MAAVGALCQDPDARSRSLPLKAGHVLAAGIVVLGVAVQLVRPLAPDLGPAPAPGQWFDVAHLERVRAYREPLYAVAVAVFGLRLAVPCLAAFTSAGRRMTAATIRRVGADRPARAAAAVVAVIVVVTDLVVLPATFWATFLHEGAYGFRTQGLAGWTYDWVVTSLPVWLVVTLLVLGGYALARRVPRAWPAVAGLGAAVLTGALVFVTPVLLEPLLFTTKPVPAGPVRAEVERILERAGHDIERILVADASRRTTKRNAYVSGLGASRRVVLYDTLVDTQTVEEVGVVVAHEIGHAQHADLLRGTLFASAGVIAVAYLLWGFARWRTATGRQAGVADPHAVAVLLAVLALVAAATVPLQNVASRRAEAAADLAALRITGAPATYLQLTERLVRANLSDPLPPRWAQHLWSTHPPPSARLQMGARWADGFEG